MEPAVVDPLLRPVAAVQCHRSETGSISASDRNASTTDLRIARNAVSSVAVVGGEGDVPEHHTDKDLNEGD
jgi:hypothetical protein